MTEIKNYAVRLNGGLSGSGEYLRAQVHLFDANNKLVAVIDFHDTAGSMHEDYVRNIIRTSMPVDRLADVVDLLRNESPIFLGWREEHKKAFISTTQEPVGEGE